MQMANQSDYFFSLGEKICRQFTYYSHQKASLLTAKPAWVIPSNVLFLLFSL